MDSEQEYVLFESNPVFNHNIIGEPNTKVLGFQIQAEKTVSDSLRGLYINENKISYISWVTMLQKDFSTINVEPYRIEDFKSMRVEVSPKEKIKIVFILEGCDRHILNEHLRIIPVIDFANPK